MKKAIWFSRHATTQAQIDDAAIMGYDLRVSEWATEVASRQIETDEDVDDIMSILADFDDSSAYFGVFAAPIQARIVSGKDGCPCFAAWNICRTPDGGKPTFDHKKFVLVGWL